MAKSLSYLGGWSNHIPASLNSSASTNALSSPTSGRFPRYCRNGIGGALIPTGNKSLSAYGEDGDIHFDSSVVAIRYAQNGAALNQSSMYQQPSHLVISSPTVQGVRAVWTANSTGASGYAKVYAKHRLNGAEVPIFETRGYYSGRTSNGWGWYGTHTLRRIDVKHQRANASYSRYQAYDFTSCGTSNTTSLGARADQFTVSNSATQSQREVSVIIKNRW
ncbi:hypothetical protein BCU85_17385 [Vibrio lentus]|nr:hypothetical protein BCV33_21315 [Vibrio lentus]PMG72970.1 hypothetical protein BCU85_17385 [Vibrio lentus]PMK89916.1 hypothetical protein BCT88_21340 [Vibrio lentus]PML25482.1 hypothetical protein BCT80_19530 [Vibrio lentus]PMM27944.1 hypothetical protein BCT57_15785 [Vibrio lentus]